MLDRMSAKRRRFTREFKEEAVRRELVIVKLERDLLKRLRHTLLSTRSEVCLPRHQSWCPYDWTSMSVDGRIT